MFSKRVIGFFVFLVLWFTVASVTYSQTWQIAAVDEADKTIMVTRTYRDLVRAADGLRRASEVLRLYKMFLAHQDISQVDRKAAEKQLPVWEKRAAKKMVRIGFRWLTPKEARDRKLQASHLVSEALRLIDVGQFDAAIDKLEKASNVDRGSLHADFLLGLGYAIIGCHAEKANSHFNECLHRDPQHIAALNNLALSEIRLKKYPQALLHWKTALELVPASPEVIQNLGRVAYLITQRRLRMSSRLQTQFTDLYAVASVTADAKKFNGKTGWLYMGYHASLGEEKLAGGDPAPRATQANTKLATIGSATGFVVHPEYILTNRHVVEAGKDFLIALPGQENLELPARVVAVADDPDSDLAILHCKGLKAPPLRFVKENFVKRGTEIMIFGFPGMLPDKTPSLKATRGIITGLPDDSYNTYTSDAITNPGNSGGPVCDETGSVLAIHAAATGSLAHLSKNYALSVPHSRALPFLEKYILGYKQLPPNTKVKKWVDVDELVSCSTVLIWIKGPSSNGGIAGKQSKGAKSRKVKQVLEDPWCMTCSGRGVVPCPNRKCNKGQITQKRRVIKAYHPNTGKAVYGTEFYQEPCPVCNGKGCVPCPDCHGGVDRSLR